MCVCGTAPRKQSPPQTRSLAVSAQNAAHTGAWMGCRFSCKCMMPDTHAHTHAQTFGRGRTNAHQHPHQHTNTTGGKPRVHLQVQGVLPGGSAEMSGMFRAGTKHPVVHTPNALSHAVANSHTHTHTYTHNIQPENLSHFFGMLHERARMRANVSYFIVSPLSQGMRLWPWMELHWMARL